VVAEIVQPVRAGEVVGRLGDDDLPAVARSGDPCRSVDVDPDIALVGDDRLAGMEADPHPDRPGLERLLTVRRRRERVFRAGERHEEGIALGVDLDTVVAGERFAEDSPVIGQRGSVSVAELAEQAGRPFDVGEEKGDGAGRQLSHRCEPTAASASDTAASIESERPCARRASSRSLPRRERSSRSTRSPAACAYVSSLS
jgi:hypothetical protein